MCTRTNIKALIECLVGGFFQYGVFPLLIGLALVAFLWGVLKFVKNAGDEKARTAGKKLIIWGLLGLFVMVCVWALVGVLSASFSGSGGVFIPQASI